MKRLFRFLIAFLALGYLAAAAYMGLNQRSFLYRTAPGLVDIASQSIPNGTNVTLTATDGVKLSGWQVPAQGADALTYLYFHGNANGLDRRTNRFRFMTADGSGLVAFSYRGYGGSDGAPTETGIHADAETIYAEITKTVPPERLVIFGESLGSGVALNLARKVKARAVILDSPYLSILARGQASYPWLPVSWLLTDTFRSDQWIREVKTPVFVFHGTADTVVPVTDSEKLAGFAQPGIVTRRTYQGERHVMPLDRGPATDISAFLRALR